MRAVDAQFSASVAWRSQVVMKTWVGSIPDRAACNESGSSRSAATGRTSGMPVCGLRARP